MDDYRFVGSRIVGFPQASRLALRAVAERLLPHEGEIVARWTARQYGVWEPPGIERAQLEAMFARLLRVMLEGMAAGEPERCIPKLEEAGVGLAQQGFPFEVLMLSLHFLEESYTPFLLRPRSRHLQEWLLRLDEFLHVAIAAIATSYFRFRRDELIAGAEVGWVIQEGLAPDIPQRAGDLQIGHAYVSAAERARLGGDFVDVFELDDGRVAFVIGDLSGHGLEAIADAVMIRSLFRGLMREQPDVTQVVTRLNRILTAELEADHFATLLAGAFSPSGDLELVNAGSPPPVHCGRRCALLESGMLPLAVSAETEYPGKVVHLDPGDLLVAYTDGLVEARTGRNLFGEARAMRELVSVSDAPAGAIAEHLLNRALAHARGQLTDDITVVALRRLAPPAT